MDSSLIVREVQELNKKATRKRKTSNKKNQPLKVVYISNPMRVQTSAAKFRALVQELTGRDAKFPDLAQFHSASSLRETNTQKIPKGDENEELVLDLAAIEDFNDVFLGDFNDVFLGDSFESLEDIFTRDIMGKLAV